MAPPLREGSSADDGIVVVRTPLLISSLRTQPPKSPLQLMWEGSKVLLLTALLLLCAMANRVGFKLAGYALGGTPFTMIFLTVACSIPLNAMGFMYMIYRTGGVLPEFRAWMYFRDYWVIATLNVGNGLAIMWSNRYVPGYVQCLLTSMAIPMTMTLSAIFFRARFSLMSMGGVLLIVAGILYVGLGQAGNSAELSLFWVGIYALAQLPLAGTSVYQEYTFKKSLNMLHYIHYVTIFLMVDLLLATPINVTVGDASSFEGFGENILTVFRCVQGEGPHCEGAGLSFGLYIVSLNAANLVQAVLIKNASATWVMIVLSLSTPLAVISFACPWIVGEDHVEAIGPAVLLSTALICAGTLVYRLGSLAPRPADGQPVAQNESSPKAGYFPLFDSMGSKSTGEIGTQTEISIGPHAGRKEILRLFLAMPMVAHISEEESKKPHPGVICAGVGLFPSEYTNATQNPLSIWEERTFAEGRGR